MTFQFNNQLGAPFLQQSDNSLDFGPIFPAAAPGINDSPLEFNKSGPPSSTNNKIRQYIMHEDESSTSSSPNEKRGRQRRCRDDNNSAGAVGIRGEDSDNSNVSQENNLIPAAAVQNVWSGMMGMGYPMVNMIMDPMLPNYGMMPPILPDPTNLIPPAPDILNNQPMKEIIYYKSCTLFPPNPNAPSPTTRDRPPGCRTVFVGGLPENMTEDIITQVFERCGEITTLRLSKKNFCHIRFVFEASVDAAIFFSGYRIRIGASGDAPNTGRLHVDYAQARDDQYEWECRQRQLQREQRHRERMEEERLRPPSPPPVVHYTDHEAVSVSEKIKQDDTFTKAVLVVITWLERGDCTKRNANSFYSMIQSTNAHVRRLLNEKTQYEDELKKAKEIMKGRMQGILLQFSQIERLFVAACHKKVWDHFTKAQRKNIETWKKLSMEVKNVQLDDDPICGISGGRKTPPDGDEMELSDEDDNVGRKRHRPSIESYDSSNFVSNVLKDENDSLRFQVEAYKNEVEVLKSEHKKESEDKDNQMKMLQQTLQGMQQQLVDARKKQNEEEARLRDLQQSMKQTAETSSPVIDLVDKDESLVGDRFDESDARLLGIISTFLNVHPFGAGLDYIWSYVIKFTNQASLRPSDIETLMNRFPSVFRQELIGIGANIERRWMFNAFNTNNSTTPPNSTN